jgi:hypothetical protein
MNDADQEEKASGYYIAYSHHLFLEVNFNASNGRLLLV